MRTSLTLRFPHASLVAQIYKGVKRSTHTYSISIFFCLLFMLLLLLLLLLLLFLLLLLLLLAFTHLL